MSISAWEDSWPYECWQTADLIRYALEQPKAQRLAKVLAMRLLAAMAQRAQRDDEERAILRSVIEALEADR